MPDVIEVSCDVTRDDWVKVNEALIRESPTWEQAAAVHRRSLRRQAFVVAPLAVAFGILVIGNIEGGGRQMRMVGGALGAAFAAFLLWALPRIDTISKHKRAALERIKQADMSDYTGPTTVAISPEGVSVRAHERDVKVGWNIASIMSVGGYTIVKYGSGGGGAVIPRRAFVSDGAADEFLHRADAWGRAAQVPAGERLTRYLADRDVACPKCGYNLRGNAGEWCPECGLKVSLEQLVDAGKTPRAS